VTAYYPENGGDTFLRNIGSHTIYMAPHPKDSILHSYRRENLKSYYQYLFKVKGSAKERTVWNTTYLVFTNTIQKNTHSLMELSPS
jgi:hypothetical protein